MKNLNGLISGMVACIVLGAFGAHGQSLAVSLTGTYSGGTAVAYAETTSDYATGYYYDLCTYISALGEEDDGTWDSYETSGNCGSTDAEVSWTFTPTGTTDFIQFAGEHDMEIQYLVYQVDEYCGSDPYACGDYWDAYEASILEGDNPGGSGAWVLWGPPAIGDIASQIAVYTTQTAGTDCLYPYAEQPAYYGPVQGVDPDGVLNTGGSYYMTLLSTNPFASYAGRSVTEGWNPYTLTGDCSALVPPPGPNPYPLTMASFGSPSTWPVSGTAYGPDIMGNQMVQIQYFQAFLAGSYAFCQLYQLQQTMQMSSCLLPSNPLSGLQYDRGHYNGIAVYAMTAISSRGGTSPYANPNPVVGAAE